MNEKAILYGSYHAMGRAYEATRVEPKTIVVEHWDGDKWVATRQVWDEQKQRYVRAEETK